MVLDANGDFYAVDFSELRAALKQSDDANKEYLRKRKLCQQTVPIERNLIISNPLLEET